MPRRGRRGAAPSREPVDRHDRAGHRGGRVAEQEGDDRGEVCRRDRVAKRLRAHRRAVRRRVDERGKHRVDAHAPRRELGGEHFGQPNDSRLADGVGGRTAAASERGARRDVDDRAALGQVPCRCAARPPRRSEVELLEKAQAVEVRVGDAARTEAPGRVDDPARQLAVGAQALPELLDGSGRVRSTASCRTRGVLAAPRRAGRRRRRGRLARAVQLRAPSRARRRPRRRGRLPPSPSGRVAPDFEQELAAQVGILELAAPERS